MQYTGYSYIMYPAELHQHCTLLQFCLEICMKLSAGCTKWRHTLHAVLVSRCQWQRVAPSLMRRTCRSFGHTRLLFGQLNCFFRLFYLCCTKELHFSTLKTYKFSGVRAALNNWFNQCDRSTVATAISLSDKDTRNSTVPLSFFPTCSICSRFPLFLVTSIRFLWIIKPFKVGNQRRYNRL